MDSIEKDERIHDLFGCYSKNSGKVFYTFPNGIGEPKNVQGWTE